MVPTPSELRTRKQNVLRAIRSQLKHLLMPLGFKACKDGEGFDRKIEGGKQHFGIALCRNGLRFEFAPVTSMRLDIVENISNLFSGTPEDLRSGTMTMVVLPDILTGVERMYPATTQDEIAASVDEVERLLIETVIPFLDAHQDLKSIDRAMNKNGLDTSFHPWRAVHSLIVAHLAGNPRFDELVSRYRDEMLNEPPQERAKYDEVVNYLRGMRPSQNLGAEDN